MMVRGIRNKRGDFSFVVKLLLLLVAAVFLFLLIKKIGGLFMVK